MKPEPGGGLSCESSAAGIPSSLGEEWLSTEWGTLVVCHNIHYGPPPPRVNGGGDMKLQQRSSKCGAQLEGSFHSK